MRPPVPYYGGKQRIAGQIVALLPPHDHYVEPYCGGLSVLFAKPRSWMETVNDLSRELMTFWRVLRERRAELEEWCDLTPHSRAEHADSYRPADFELEVARRVFVRLTQGRSHRMTDSGWRFDVRRRGQSPPNAVLRARVGRFQEAADRLAGVTLECLPAMDIISRYGESGDVLLYVDPPYLGETRNGEAYEHEMADPGSHVALAEALRAVRAAAVVSGYPSDLYDRELYAGWHRVELAARTNQGSGESQRTEVLWSNRPLGTQPTLFEVAS